MILKEFINWKIVLPVVTGVLIAALLLALFTTKGADGRMKFKVPLKKESGERELAGSQVANGDQLGVG